MATKIQSDQIQNLQQLEAVVASPNDANRLFIIDEQFHSDLVVSSQGNITRSTNEIFAALLGLGLKSEQFHSGNCDSIVYENDCRLPRESTGAAGSHSASLQDRSCGCGFVTTNRAKLN